MQLVDKIEKRHNRRAANIVANYFTAMDMPLPEANEYTVTSDDGFLVFLDDPACVIRGIFNPKLREDKGRHCLRPLLERRTPQCDINLYPGVRAPISYRDIPCLTNIIKRDGHDFQDYQRHNAGYLPVTNKKFKRGVPVIIDMGAVRQLDFSTRFIRQALIKCGLSRPQTGPHEQDEIFSDLKQAFAAAWAPEQTSPCPAAMDRAWQACLDAKAEGLLVADWQNMGQSGKAKANFKNAKSGGALYAQRWNYPAEAVPRAEI